MRVFVFNVLAMWMAVTIGGFCAFVILDTLHAW